MTSNDSTILESVGAFDRETIAQLATLTDDEAQALGAEMSERDYPGIDRQAYMVAARDAARKWLEA